MKLYKLSVIALAFAGIFTACSDDDDFKYVPAEQSPGAYFPVDGEMTVLLKDGSSSADIPVYRTVAGQAQTVQVTAEFSEDGIFTAENQVSFAADATVAYLKVNYDPSKIVMDRKYTCTVSLAANEVSEYGIDSSKVTLMLKSPTVTVAGPKGTYYYTQFFEGTDPGLKTTISHPETSETVLTYNLQDWAMGVTLPIEVHTDMVDDYGCYLCFVPETYIGYEHSAYGSVYACDVYTYTGRDDFKDASFYDPTTGLFSLNMVYFVSAGVFGNGYEYLQLDGFPDYSINVTYDGLFTEASGLRSYAVATVDVGADVQEARVVNIEGDDVASVIDQIGDGSMDAMTLNAGLGQEVRFEIAADGTYTLVALSMVDGEIQNIAYDTYTIQRGAGDSGSWETLGYSPFVDGWIMPWFGMNPFDYADEIYVEVQQNLDDPNIYRLKNPYNIPFYASANEGTGIANIEIDTTNPDVVVVMPQYSGFSATLQGLPWVDWYVGEIAGFLINDGEDIEDYVDVLVSRGMNSTFADGVIEIAYPAVGTADDCEYVPATEDGEELGFVTVIDLNQLEQAPARHTSAMRVNATKAPVSTLFGHNTGKKTKRVLAIPANPVKMERIINNHKAVR